MKVKKFTDPITGIQFYAPMFNNRILLTNAITGEKMNCPISHGDVCIPLSWFKDVEMANSPEVCEELKITRARLSQLVSKEVLKPIHIGNEHYFLREHVLEYKRTRKNGRPRKRNDRAAH